MSTQETALAADSVESFDQLLNLFGRYSTSTNPNKTSANSDLLDRANTLLSARLSLIPILPGTKRPPHGFTWKEFQTRLATPNEVHDWLQKYPGC